MRMRTNVRVVMLFLAAALVVAATAAGCGASTDDLTAPTGNGDGGIGGGETGTSNGDDAAASTEAGGGGGDTDGGTEGGPGGNVTTLTCGTAACSIPAQACCVGDPRGPGLTFACVSGACPVVDGGGNGGGDNSRPIALKCSSQANCNAGTVCCITSNGQGTRSECKATCGGGGGDTAQLCDPNASAETSGCPQNRACSNDNIDEWRLPETFGTCGGVGN